MPEISDPLMIGAGVLLLLNCLVSLRIRFAKTITTSQKLVQTAIVWVLPFIGAILVYLVHKSDAEPRGPAEPPFGGGASDGMPGGVQ